MTPSEIESATFRFVAQYLNHCATISGPRNTVYSETQIQPNTTLHFKLHKVINKTRILLHISWCITDIFHDKMQGFERFKRGDVM
jgi:hypothetical protein